MTDDPIDLSPFDPASDAERLDGVVRATARDAMRARQVRDSRQADLFAILAGMTRPALLAAALAVAVAIPVVARTMRPVITPASATDVLGIPRPLMELMRSKRTPSLTELHQALEPIAPDVEDHQP